MTVALIRTISAIDGPYALRLSMIRSRQLLPQELGFRFNIHELIAVEAVAAVVMVQTIQQTTTRIR